MQYVSVGDFRLHYEETGPLEEASGRAPVVLLHGFTLDHRMWEEAVAYLSRERRVIAMDARGHGLSDAPATGYSRADRVEDLAVFVDRVGLGRFHLVGLSMGGSTAIGYALSDQSRLVSLTLASTGAAGWDIGKKMSRVEEKGREIRKHARKGQEKEREDFDSAVAKGRDYVRGKWIEYSLRYFGEEQGELRERMERMMREHSGAAWMDERRGRYPDPGKDLERAHEIRVPTLIIAGEKDRVFVPLAEELGRRIAGGRVVVYAGVGHMVNMEAPERFNQEVVGFLRGAEEFDIGR